MTYQKFNKFRRALPATTYVVQWGGSHVWKVGGKVFAIGGFIAGGALWIDYGVNGAGKSKLTPLVVDKACGSPATGRNWNSVLKIGEMIAARG